MLAEFLKQDHGQQVWAGEAARRDMERCRRLRDRLALPGASRYKWKFHPKNMILSRRPVKSHPPPPEFDMVSVESAKSVVFYLYYNTYIYFRQATL